MKDENDRPEAFWFFIPLKVWKLIIRYCWWFWNPTSPAEGTVVYPIYLKGPIHPRWCRISSINSIIFPWKMRTIFWEKQQRLITESMSTLMCLEQSSPHRPSWKKGCPTIAEDLQFCVEKMCFKICRKIGTKDRERVQLCWINPFFYRETWPKPPWSAIFLGPKKTWTGVTHKFWFIPVSQPEPVHRAISFNPPTVDV